ncbi:hypothetical protein ACM66B_006444 [Microbotryomycetes sp. NB124-2]
MSGSLNVLQTASSLQLASSFRLSSAWSSRNPTRNEALAPWLQQNWALAGTISKKTSRNMQFVPTSEGTQALRVEYPAGTKGGVQFWMQPDELIGAQTAVLSYTVITPPNWVPVKGGKLPGLYGGERRNECSGGERSASCFSARLMWRASGFGEVYGYMPIYERLCAQSDVECGNDVYGISLSRGAWQFQPHSATRVTQLVSLNLPGYANGLLLVYVNDTLVLAQTGLIWRIADVNISHIVFSTFYGGSGKEYLPAKDQHLLFTDFKVGTERHPIIVVAENLFAGFHFNAAVAELGAGDGRASVRFFLWQRWFEIVPQ